MTDVAERTGVSLKTVSRVVNGEPGVTAATTARVRDDLELAGLRACPPSTVSYDAADLGRGATRLLTALLEGDYGPTRRVILPTQLVHRGLGEAA